MFLGLNIHGGIWSPSRALKLGEGGPRKFLVSIHLHPNTYPLVAIIAEV